MGKIGGIPATEGAAHEALRAGGRGLRSHRGVRWFPLSLAQMLGVGLAAWTFWGSSPWLLGPLLYLLFAALVLMPVLPVKISIYFESPIAVAGLSVDELEHRVVRALESRGLE
jgi:hypothetical protein